MYLMIAGLVLMGAVCGATIRLLPFGVVLIGAAAIAAISSTMHGDGNGIVTVVIAVVAPQVGYALGIVGRAMLGSWQQHRTLGIRSAPEPRITLSRENPP